MLESHIVGRRAEVKRVLAYIAAHPDPPMAVAEIARVAGLSAFHLHRVLREALDETPTSATVWAQRKAKRVEVVCRAPTKLAHLRLKPLHRWGRFMLLSLGRKSGAQGSAAG